MGSDATYGNNGAFFIPGRPGSGPPFKVIASDGDGMPDNTQKWEHVSVSLPHRVPEWKEMCFIKAHFWDDDDTVVQFHPPRSEWVNNHNYCLHMWRPVGVELIRPAVDPGR
jgi:hypothetical protein